MASYICSDLHLNHFNILKLEAHNLKKNHLDYITTMEEYNDMIISRINTVVGPKDTLYIIGDFAFGGFDRVAPLVQRINGYKVFLMGNHDKYQLGQAKGMGFDEVYQGPIYLPGSRGRIIICHYPVKEALDNPYVICLHGHLHGSWLDLPNFKNVNIALNNYYPIDLEPYFKKIDVALKSRREKWLHEWYAEYQVFDDKEREDLVLDPNGKINLEATLAKNNN